MNDAPRGTSSRVVLAGFFALIAVAVAGFALLYFRLLGYDRVAVRHVPASAVVAARVDLRQVVLFAPLREHVVPVLSRAIAPGRDAKSSLGRIEEATGVNLGMDVFEVVVAQGQRGLGIVFGGRLPDDGVVRGLAELTGKACRLDGERLSCDSPRVFVEQAEDGAVVAATDPALLDEMLPQGDAHVAIGLDAEQAGSFAFVTSRFPGFGATGLWSSPPSLDLSRLERIEGRLELADPVLLHLEAVPGSGASLADWPEKLAALQSASAPLFALVPGGDFAGERAVFSRLKFGVRGNRATADATWERHEIDQAAKSLGAWLGRWLQSAE